MTRYRFHTTVHLRPAQVANGPEIVVDGIRVQTLDVKPLMLSNPMRVSFEEAADVLQKLPRMFLEPDGSFVWVSEQGNDDWQVDGVLYDRNGRLMFVDLKGECPDEAFKQLLVACGASASPLMFQLVRQAVFLDEQEFRRCTAVSGS